MGGAYEGEESLNGRGTQRGGVIKMGGGTQRGGGVTQIGGGTQRGGGVTQIGGGTQRGGVTEIFAAPKFLLAVQFYLLFIIDQHKQK